MTEQSYLKQCPLCRTTWASLRDLVLDPELELAGYMANFADPQRGLILLTHHHADCGTTLAVKAADVRYLYNGPGYAERRTAGPACRRYCLQRSMIEECAADCDMAWVRTAMQYLRRHEWPAHLAA